MGMPTRFHALRSRREHARVNAGLARLFRARGARRTRTRLAEGVLPTLYLDDLDIWLVAHALPNRYRNALGPGDPIGRRTLWPSVQLNLALAPGSARPQARFVRDDRDRIWVAHSGTLGGRQPGISRTAFVALLGGARTVTIDGRPEQLVVLGTFAEPDRLLGEIGRLTHTADQFRTALAAGLSLQP
jgi:hypothetical protein